MKKWTPALMIALLSALIASFTFSLRTDGGEAQPRVRIRGRCQTCHPAHAQEWTDSIHAKAWSSPLFAETTNNYAKTECLACHAPDKQIETGYGKQPKLRDQLRESGVDCVSCHEDAKGAHHGTQGTKTEDHPVVKSALIGTVTHCAGCHNDNGTVDEFKASKWGKDGAACVTCHMPEVKRVMAVDPQMKKKYPVRPGRQHFFHGADSVELVRKGVKLEASAANGNVMAKISSVEVGHKFPTGFYDRAVALDVRTKDGAPVQQVVFADERTSGGQDTRLNPEEVRTVTIPLNGKTGAMSVRLLYKVHKKMKDDQAQVIYDLTVDAK